MSDRNPTKLVLFPKSTAEATPTGHPLVLGDFEDAGSLSGACSSLHSWPGTLIYQTIGSHHFTDVRRNTIGLIMTFGSSAPTPKGPVPALERNYLASDSHPAT